jgi:hypothetical protein
MAVTAAARFLLLVFLSSFQVDRAFVCIDGTYTERRSHNLGIASIGVFWLVEYFVGMDGRYQGR